MTARRLCLLVASLSVCAIAQASTLQTGEIARTTDLNLGALTATLTGLTALGMFLSVRCPLFAARKSGASPE